VSIHTVYFIGSILSLDEHPTFRETIIEQFSDPYYDWNNFIWTCSNHLVLPAIYLKFRDHNLLFCIPDVLANHLKEIYELNRIRNEQILLQVKEITATLNLAGISPIFMKGTGNLIAEVYNDIGERIIGDIDLLVQENEYLATIERAKTIGYTNYWGEPRNPMKMKHYPRLYKLGVPADLEIHRIPVKSEYSSYFSSEMMFRQKTAIVNLPGCFVPCNNDKIIQNFIHSQLSNSGHRLGTVSLRDINDIYLLSKKSDLATAFAQINKERETKAYIAIFQKLLGLPITISQSVSSRFFLWKHDLNLTSAIFYKINRIPWVIAGIILHGYPKQIKEAIQYSEARQSLLKRIVSPKWYVHHFNIYKKLISGN